LVPFADKKRYNWNIMEKELIDIYRKSRKPVEPDRSVVVRLDIEKPLFGKEAFGTVFSVRMVSARFAPFYPSCRADYEENKVVLHFESIRIQHSFTRKIEEVEDFGRQCADAYGWRIIEMRQEDAQLSGDTFKTGDPDVDNAGIPAEGIGGYRPYQVRKIPGSDVFVFIGEFKMPTWSLFGFWRFKKDIGFYNGLWPVKEKDFASSLERFEKRVLIDCELDNIEDNGKENES